MHSAPILAALATTILASPVTKRDGCTFSPFESANLLHGHDVNTGKIKAGGVIIESGIVFGGSKCSPAWAVGGKLDDATPTIYVGTAKEISPADLSKLLGPLAGSTQGDLAGLLGTLGGSGVTDVSGLLKGLGGYA